MLLLFSEKLFDSGQKLLNQKESLLYYMILILKSKHFDTFSFIILQVHFCRNAQTMNYVI